VRGGLTRRMLISSGLLALIIGTAFAVLLSSVADLRTPNGAPGSPRRCWWRPTTWNVWLST
jgi:hypothetical protein